MSSRSSLPVGRLSLRVGPRPRVALLVATALICAGVAGCDKPSQPMSAVQDASAQPDGNAGAPDDSPPPQEQATPPPPGQPPAAEAPASGDAEGSVEFTAEQLEQMVAPVALYPDPLLMDVLMAATYPAEVAEAAAWHREHPNLNGKALDDAIADKGWDVSVNSLTHATQAIELMGADPQWTSDLGEAFLA